MKRNGLSPSLVKDCTAIKIPISKDYSSASAASSPYAANNKSQTVKEFWDIGEEEYSYTNGGGGGGGGIFPWPPRSYSCSFCRKEFKSAQALGGHMNVHRRDRARLRQSPPPPPPPRPTTTTTHDHHGPMLNLNLNPNFSSSSSSSTSCGGHKHVTSCTTTTTTTATLPLFVSPPPPPPNSELKRWYHGAFARGQDGCKLVSKKGEIGLFPTKQDSHDLDLELRLGTYSS